MKSVCGKTLEKPEGANYKVYESSSNVIKSLSTLLRVQTLCPVVFFFSIQNDSYSESDVSQTHIVKNGEKKPKQTRNKMNACILYSQSSLRQINYCE